VEAFGDYLADLDQVVALARRQPGMPLALMGHSLGGLVVLSQALEVRAGTVSRIVAAAPWLKLNTKIHLPTRDAAKVFRRLRPALEMENLVRTSDLSGDPEVARSLESDPLIHHVLTARGFASVLEQQDQLRSTPTSVAAPTLILMGGQDHVVSSDAATDFASKAAGQVQIQFYPAMGHGLFFESDWRTVVHDLAEWLLGEVA
jgi:alpha-beta hydrolase superfamily lysophospholipase